MQLSVSIKATLHNHEEINSKVQRDFGKVQKRDINRTEHRFPQSRWKRSSDWCRNGRYMVGLVRRVGVWCLNSKGPKYTSTLWKFMRGKRIPRRYASLWTIFFSGLESDNVMEWFGKR